MNKSIICSCLVEYKSLFVISVQKLTGGVLLSRNKDFLVFYRGKNFLSQEVTEALLERERLAQSLQDEEELARLRATALVMSSAIESDELVPSAGTLSETLDANAKWAKKLDKQHKEKVMKEAEIARHAELIRKLERKLSQVSHLSFMLTTMKILHFLNLFC